MVTPDDALFFGGDKLIELSAGKAIVFVADINENSRVDIEDVVGVSVSRGTELTSHINIHGDIVANLTKKGELSGAGRDGSVLDPKTHIARIEVLATELESGFTTHGIVSGQILAGGSISHVTVEGGVSVIAAGTAAGGRDIFADVTALVQGVQVGPVTLDPMAAGKSGASINDVNISVGDTGVNDPGLLSLIQAGDAGLKGPGGSVSNVVLTDLTQGYAILAGAGGSSAKAGAGGSITNVEQSESAIDGIILLSAGSGGDALSKGGGAGGHVNMLDIEGPGDYVIAGGDGGGGGASGNGGQGGNISDVDLNQGNSYIITAGTGGDGGRAGGNGGSITRLTNDAAVESPEVPSFVLAANFNGDVFPNTEIPVLDLLTINSEDDSISIYLNDGDGNFTLSGVFSVGDDPRRATVFDLEGDGNLDVVVSNFGDNTVSVLQGRADGTFEVPVVIPVGMGPIGVAIGQVNDNSDNLLDLVVANSLDDTLTLLLGTGGGRFQTEGPFTINVADSPTFFTTGDLDFTGDLDIAVLSSTLDTANILLGLGDGSFGALQPFDTGGEGPVDIQNAQLDSTIFLDLVVVNQTDNSVSVLSGLGGFPTINYDTPQVIEVGSSPTSAAIVNLNANARPEIVVANGDDNTITVLLNDGFGNYSEGDTFNVGSNPVSIAAGDFDNDGNQDVAVANQGSATISILFGKGDGTFEVAGEDTGGVIIRAGDGGNGGSGAGGHGGFIGLDTSRTQPEIINPNVRIAAVGGEGAIGIRAGSGGDGTTGGRGGTISSLDLSATQAVSIESGSGGDGSAGRGGDGGGIGRGSPDPDVNASISLGGEASDVSSGSGGDGTTGGGNGGVVTNTSVITDGELDISTGDGGSATVSGKGGDAGSLAGSEFAASPFLAVTTGSGGDSIGTTGADGGSVQESQFQVTGSAVLDPVIPDPGNISLRLGDGGSGVVGGRGGRLTASDFDLVFTEVPVGGGFVESNELVLQVFTGSGGDGTVDGGDAGNVENIKVLSTQSVLVPSFFVAPGDIFIDLGAGGDGATGTGGEGGSLKNLTAIGVTANIEVNNIDPLDGGRNGRGGDGLIGGDGGQINGVTHEPSQGLTGGTLALRGGDGGTGNSGDGGDGGGVTDVRGEFTGQSLHEDGTLTEGMRLLGGNGGLSASAAGGAGGGISQISVANGGTTSNFAAGAGGDGSLVGGEGGTLSQITSTAAQGLSFQAGDGGSATALGGLGGDGGNVNGISQDGGLSVVVQQVIAGNGGNAASGTGGQGGTIQNVSTLGDIGSFNGLAFGVNSMGGLFAGAGGLGLTDGANGSVLNVSANRIASIVAGSGAGPLAVTLLDGITANAIGANTDGDTDPGEFVLPAFDFVDADSSGDYTLGADPLHDPAEAPIDGLVLADAIGTINLPDNIVALFTVNVEENTFVGNLDPQAP